jgi:hypothetical protein
MEDATCIRAKRKVLLVVQGKRIPVVSRCRRLQSRRYEHTASAHASFTNRHRAWTNQHLQSSNRSHTCYNPCRGTLKIAADSSNSFVPRKTCSSLTEISSYQTPWHNLTKCKHWSLTNTLLYYCSVVHMFPCPPSSDFLTEAAYTSIMFYMYYRPTRTTQEMSTCPAK